MPTKRYSVERILPKLRQGGRIKYRALKDDEARRLKALEQEPRGRVIVVALPNVATRRVKVSPEPVPKEGSLERVAARRPGSTEFKRNLRRRRHYRPRTPSLSRRCSRVPALTTKIPVLRGF